MTEGTRTARAIVLLHGLTDSPRQFEAFAYLLHADGSNGYVHASLAERVAALREAGHVR